MPAHHALVVVGSGPGIGRNTAALFGAQGFSHVVLMSRNAARLSEDATFVRGAAPDARVDTVPVDLTDIAGVRTALAEVGRKLEESGAPLEVVIHNAARVGPAKIPDWPVEELEADLRTAVISMYAVAQWAHPQLLQTAEKGGQPAFLVTSGLLWKDPFPQLFSLSACKGAQYNLVHSMFKDYTPKGVHCGLIVVGGQVKDDAKLTSAKNVAAEFWKFYQQPKGQWELETTMLDPDYEEMLNRRRQGNH